MNIYFTVSAKLTPVLKRVCDLSVWAIRSGDISVWAISVWGHFGLGRFGHRTFRSDYEILQKSYMFRF